MTARNLLSAAAGGIILMGCAYPLPSIMSAEPCVGQHCEVAVSARQHDMPGFACLVDRVAPYELEVRHPRPVTVTLRIDVGSAADGYRFHNPGIAFDDPAGWQCRNAADDKQVECINKAGPGRHKYTVYVKKGTASCEPHDPYVVNQ